MPTAPAAHRLRQANDFIAVFIDALDGGHVDRRRQIVDDGVEQRLHALVLERRAAQHRKERAGQHSLADQPLQRRLIGLLAVEDRPRAHRRRVRRRLPASSRDIPWPCRRDRGNVDVVEIGAERLVFPDHALHADEIDQALEVVLRADRQLDRDRLGAEAVDDIVEAFEEVGAGLVHLIGEDDARNLVLVALTPDGFGLRLHALVRSRARTPRRRARATNARLQW